MIAGFVHESPEQTAAHRQSRARIETEADHLSNRVGGGWIKGWRG